MNHEQPTHRKALTIAHGTLGCLAAMLFPLGAILLRLLPHVQHPGILHGHPVSVHAGVLWGAYVLYLMSIALGIALLVQLMHGTSRPVDTHTILGAVMTALVLVQPWVGWRMHMLWVRLNGLNRSSSSSDADVPKRDLTRINSQKYENELKRMRERLATWHVWAGRLNVLGVLVNGGLGLAKSTF